MDKPVIVQSDMTLLLDVHSTFCEEARGEIIPFCELVKSPEHVHTYLISPLSLWNAASAGVGTDSIVRTLKKWSRFEVPENVLFTVGETIGRFGKISLLPGKDTVNCFLSVSDDLLLREISGYKKLEQYLSPVSGGFSLSIYDRGTIKQELIALGYPVKDSIPLKEGDPCPVKLMPVTRGNKTFSVRQYQSEAADAFLGKRVPGTGFGVIVLPCGAGKTIVGMKVMEMLEKNTLILTTNIAAVHQWMDELLDKTTLTEDDLGEYTGDRKEIKPVTIATYQIITYRKRKENEYPHFALFSGRNWGLIIYDEVHLLPAPVFRITAEIQSVRRLGLTATLVREDNRERDVFALVGPKRFDVPWKELEAKGWIAEASCVEIRVPLLEEDKIPYAVADKRKKFRIASENPVKIEVVKQIIQKHSEDAILVIGQYVKQLESIAAVLKVPLITGKTPNPQREAIYARFKKGEVKIIVVSKVANFAIDLPDASVAVQISGTFGSRQEEAQRLGRILRPKEKNSYFYSIVSHYTVEETFSANRQKFLAEQGYKYFIELWNEREISFITS